MFGNSNWKALRKIQTNGRVGYGNAMMRTIGAVTRKQCCSYDTGIRKSQATSYYETNYLTDNNNCDKHNSNAIRNHFRYYSSTTATTMPQSDAKNTVRITYIESNGKEITVDAEIGKNLMEVAHDNNIDLEGRYSI